MKLIITLTTLMAAVALAAPVALPSGTLFMSKASRS
jgi:hypothetical protein